MDHKPAKGPFSLGGLAQPPELKGLDKKINLEVVTRRIATGSILGHTACKEGQVFKPLITQFYYKDDFLHDPLLAGDFLIHLYKNKFVLLYNQMISKNSIIFLLLEKAFTQFKYQLVDIKLEYGIVDGELTLIDEITASQIRLWPYKDKIDAAPPNLINALTYLNPDGRLDKDLYRKGVVSLEEVKNKFQDIADITDQFKNI